MTTQTEILRAWHAWLAEQEYEVCEPVQVEIDSWHGLLDTYWPVDQATLDALIARFTSRGRVASAIAEHPTAL